MLTRYITSVTTSFCPFNPRSGKTARTFLALLPSNARGQGMKIDVKMMPRSAIAQPGKLALGFKDGKTMDIDLETQGIIDIEREVDRHSRILKRQDELNG